MKILIKVVTALVAVAGVAYWVFCRIRDSKLRMELEEMDMRASEMYDEQDEDEEEETEEN